MTSDNDRRRGLLARLRRERSVAPSRGRRRLGAAVRLIAALMLAASAVVVRSHDLCP